MKFNVLKKDIRLGLPGNPRECPVSRAIRRKLKDSKVSVIGHYIRINGEEVNAPKSVQRFVDRFDGSKPVRPFTFNLKTP